MNPLSMKRRTALKGMAATLGVLSLRGFEVIANGAVHYTHGVASGDPLSDRVILWTRVLPGDGANKPLKGRWQVALDVNFRRMVAQGDADTGPERDYTVKIDATGLEPAGQYWYRFVFDGVSSPVGRTRTLPKTGLAPFTLAVCSCSNYPQGYFNAYRDIADAPVDAVMHLGDYIYEYGAGTYSNPVATGELGREVVPGHEIVALEDYRQRYGLYRTDSDLQAAHAAHPWICVWDDHELANDTWHSGAQNHNEGEGDFDNRVAMARKAYHEWMPIRTPAQTDQGPIYRRFAVGDLADIIMLDTRLIGRDQQLDYRRDMGTTVAPDVFKRTVLGNPERTMIGAEQSGWLAQQLASSKARGATWQLIGQQVLMGKLMIPQIPSEQLASVQLPERTRQWIGTLMQLADVGFPLNLDAWDGYPACRERVFADFLELANNPVVVAGDTHNAWAFNLRTEAGLPVGIEVGCPGISSPGIETYLPLPPPAMAAALKQASPELVDLDTHRRGWAKVTLTREATYSQWRFVDTVLSKTFTISETAPLRCSAGARQFA